MQGVSTYILSKTQDLLKIPQIEIFPHHGLPTQIAQSWKTLHVLSLYLSLIF